MLRQAVTVTTGRPQTSRRPAALTGFSRGLLRRRLLFGCLPCGKGALLLGALRGLVASRVLRVVVKGVREFRRQI